MTINQASLYIPSPSGGLYAVNLSVFLLLLEQMISKYPKPTQMCSKSQKCEMGFIELKSRPVQGFLSLEALGERLLLRLFQQSLVCESFFHR